MKTLIIYHSKTGFTKKYALWLNLDCPVLPFHQAKSMDLTTYDTVIFATYFYIGRITKLKWLKKQTITNKIVLVTGASPADTPDVPVSIDKNFTQGEEHYPVFYVQAGLAYDKMSILDRNMMKLKSNMVKKSHGEQSAQYKGVSNSFDACSKDALLPIHAYLSQLQ